MAKVTVRKDELDLVVETARRAAKRTNSVVVVAEDRLDLASDVEDCQVATPRDGKTVTIFN
jgi:hypothetical protein